MVQLLVPAAAASASRHTVEQAALEETRPLIGATHTRPRRAFAVGVAFKGQKTDDQTHGQTE